MARKKSFNSAIIFVLLLSALLFISSDNYITGFAVDDEWNQSTTTVTESSSTPSLVDVKLNNEIPIDLTAATTKVVNCEATVTDTNGYSDIQTGYGNITVYNTLATDSTCTPNNLNCYENITYGISTPLGADICPNTDTTTATCTLSVAMQFNTNQSANWACNMTVADNGGSTGHGVSLTPTGLNELKAININDSTMAFGTLEPLTFSDEIAQEISNHGNIVFNLSVNGTELDCEGAAPNISVGNISYNVTGPSATWGDYNLTGTLIEKEFNLYPNTTVTATTPVAPVNSTWWRLYLPQSSQSRGTCEGTIWFVGS